MASQTVEDDAKKAQIRAYIAWVNVQLKKKSDSRVIEDLSSDLKDGVALSHLVEIVAGEPLKTIFETPANTNEMEHNVQCVIAFMHDRKIRMHHTTAKDIVAGNTKSIMRLILALAAHFKPNSVKQSTKNKTSKEFTVAGLAQEAATTLAGVRRNILNVNSRPKRPRFIISQHRTEVPSDFSSHSDQVTYHVASINNQPFDQSSDSTSMPSRSSPMSNDLELYSNGQFSTSNVPKNKPVDLFEVNENSSQLSCYILKYLNHEHHELATEMNNTKMMLLHLEEVLICGEIGRDQGILEATHEDKNRIQSGSLEDEVLLLRSKLLQLEGLTKYLTEELSQVRNENMKLQGVKTGLQQRLSEQEHAFLVMKADLLRAGFKHETFKNDIAQLQKQLIQKDELILELRENFLMEQKHHDMTARALRLQIQDLHNKLQKVDETEVTLSTRVAAQQHKMSCLEGKIMQSQSNTTKPSSTYNTNNEIDKRKDSFPSNTVTESTSQSLDQLECNISVLMNKLQISESGKQSNIYHTNQHRNNLDTPGQTTVTAEKCKSQLASSIPSTSSQNHNSHNKNEVTKVLYFTERTVSPFMCSVPKMLGQVTLRDVKHAVNKPGNYRYRFKSLDAEFGTVKEEIMDDDSIIPGWESKIVVWVEEDHG